jgi:uncharacterized protein (DUF2225 family)
MDDLFRKEMRFQEARDVINSLIGKRSAWIYEEEHKSEPDRARIEKWDQETSALYRERKNLEFEDDQIHAVLSRYGPQVIAENQLTAAQNKKEMD